MLSTFPPASIKLVPWRWHSSMLSSPFVSVTLCSPRILAVQVVAPQATARAAQAATVTVVRVLGATGYRAATVSSQSLLLVLCLPFCRVLVPVMLLLLRLLLQFTRRVRFRVCALVFASSS